jgi:hypothetical protein
MSPVAHRFAGDDMDSQLSAEWHIEALGQRRETVVRFDLQLMTWDEDSVEAEAADPHEYSRPRAVFEHEAQALLFGLEAS